MCQRLVAGVSAASAPGNGLSGARSSRDGHRGAFDLGADVPTLLDFPEVPWLRFARENTGDEGSGAGGDGLSVSAPATACEDTTRGAEPPSETAGFNDVSAAPREATVADGLKLHHVGLKDEKLVHGFPVVRSPDGAQPPAETTDPSDAHEHLSGVRG